MLSKIEVPEGCKHCSFLHHWVVPLKKLETDTTDDKVAVKQLKAELAGTRNQLATRTHIEAELRKSYNFIYDEWTTLKQERMKRINKEIAEPQEETYYVDSEGRGYSYKDRCSELEDECRALRKKLELIEWACRG